MTATEHTEALKHLDWCEAQSILNMAKFYLDELRVIGKGKYRRSGDHRHPAKVLQSYGLVAISRGHGGRKGGTSWYWYLTPLGLKTLAKLSK